MTSRRSVGNIEPYRNPAPEQSTPEQSTPEEEATGADPALVAPVEREDPGLRRLAVRFGAASAAAGYLGQLLDGGPRNPVVRHGDGAWWVEGDLSLLLARELARLSGGRVYLVLSDRLLLDPGWGQAPEPDRAESRPAAGLVEVPSLDLVRAAGLRTRPARRPRQLHVLAPAERAAVWLRRGLDLGLSSSYRPVLVTPLFADPGPTGLAEAGTLTEIRLQAVRRDGNPRGELPASLLSALVRDPDVLACRSTGRLMIQHGQYSPLPDRQLEFLLHASGDDGDGAAVAADRVCVLADPPHGCLSLVPLAGYTDAWQLVQLGPAHRLEPADLAGADEPDAEVLPPPSRLTVVPTSRTGDRLDALLLDQAELGFLQALLENHPLAELAQLVPGRDQHLLMAPGGIIDRIPLGRALARVAPVPVYVAHGWRTAPRLPAAAWRELAAAMGNRAVVLEPNRALAFDLTLARPVWELWAGELPPFDYQLPEGAEAVLLDLDAASAARTTALPPGPAERPEALPDSPQARRRRWVERITGRARPAREPVSWQEEAMGFVRAGDPGRAARLHEQHGDYIRAGRLFEDEAELKGNAES
jgi:FtsH ternary system domain X7